MKKIKKNIGLSFITASSKIFGGIGVLMILAHFLSLKDFGLFTYILTVTSSIILLIDYGFNIKLLIDIPRNLNEIERIISTSIRIKCLFFFITSIFILVFYLLGFLENDQIILSICIFISLFLFSLNNTFLSLFKSVNNYLLEAKIVFLDNILLFIIVFLTVQFTDEIYLVGVSFLLVKIITFLFSLFFFNKQFSLIYISFNKQFQEIKNGLSFAIHYIVGNFFLNLDTLILAYFVSQEDLGVYQSGVRLIIGTGVLLTIVNSVYLPLLSKETNLIYRTKELNFYLILIGFIIASPFIFVPEYLITVIYGEKFLIAADIYKIFGLIIFLRIIGSSY